jgi:hypothetical protein
MAFSLQQSYSYHRSNIYDASLATVTVISFVDAVVLKGFPIIHRLDDLVMVLPCHTIYTFFCRMVSIVSRASCPLPCVGCQGADHGGIEHHKGLGWQKCR